MAYKKNQIIALLLMPILACCERQTEQTAQPLFSPVQNDNNLSVLTKISQQSLNQLADTLQVKYRFISNIETDCPDLKGAKVEYCYSAEIILTNPVDAHVSDWQINYSQVYMTFAAQSDEFTLEHVNGDIHQITPTANFNGFRANQSKRIKLWVKSTVSGESALLPNYWLSSDGLAPAVIASTRTTIDSETGLEVQPYVVPFRDQQKQIKAAPADINAYASAEWLYQHNKDLTQQTEHLATAIIPTPKSLIVTNADQSLDISQGLAITLTNIESAHIEAGQARLELLGVKFVERGVPVHIRVSDDASSEVNTTNHSNSNTSQPLGSYRLVISAEGISIDAGDNSGAFYGLQSVAALLQVGQLQLPLVEIEDAPHYDYRGQHIDVARNFHSKEMIFALIKQMAAYKLNKLHLHLAEDEGWRLALPSFPELTAIGSKRCMDLSDQQCLQPQLGGADNPEVDGFYSVDDYQQILAMATRHHIQVIPSLDMPGHSRAAVKAMEARYRFYAAQGNRQEAERYLLSDFADKTEYLSIQQYNDNTINVCMESSYRFVDRVLEDLIAIHQQAEHPLTMYHIGADETAGAWLQSPVCQALVADQSNKIDDLKHLGGYFIERIAAMINAKGIAVGGWNDGLAETNVKQMPKEVYSYIWGALPWGVHQQVSAQARRNWQLVLSIPDVLYFDFPYEIDPKERGYAWASRRVNSRTLFNFMPDNLPIHAEFRVDTLGQPFAIDDRLQQADGKITHQPLPENYRVKGIQGQLWSETVRSEQQAEYMIFPRLLALAERAWHSASWSVAYNYQGAKYDQSTAVFSDELRTQRDAQWQKFNSALSLKELVKLERAEVFYRLPTVGALVENNTLKTNTSLFGLPIEYRHADGPWQRYQGPVAVTKPIEIRATTHNGKRAGRSLTVQ